MSQRQYTPTVVALFARVEKGISTYTLDDYVSMTGIYKWNCKRTSGIQSNV